MALRYITQNSCNTKTLQKSVFAFKTTIRSLSSEEKEVQNRPYYSSRLVQRDTSSDKTSDNNTNVNLDRIDFKNAASFYYQAAIDEAALKVSALDFF